MKSGIISKVATATPEIQTNTQDFLKALASETRQQILQLFEGGIELTGGEVAELAGLSQSTVSKHLGLLRRGGLVQATRDGKTVRYRVDSGRVASELDQLKDYLISCCPPVR